MTPDPDGTIERTDSGGVIRFERRLRHPVDEVWSAITEPERLGSGGCRSPPTSASICALVGRSSWPPPATSPWS